MRILHQLFIVSLCTSTALLSIPISSIATLFQGKPQSYIIPQIAGIANSIYRFDVENFNALFSVSVGFSRSFNEGDVKRCLFHNDLMPTPHGCAIHVSGSNVPGRDVETEWLADYFGLPTDFESFLFFNPRVENALAHFYTYIGFDEWCPNVYFMAHVPLVHTRWNMNFTEKIIDSGSTDHPFGYFGPTEIARKDLLPDVRSFMNGETPNLGTVVTFEPLKCSKIHSCGALTDTRLGDLHMFLGWNMFNEDDHHFGIALKLVAPLGTRPKSEYLFEPIIGNAKFWELGAGITSHVLLWLSCNEHKNLSFHIEAFATHPFSTHQKRVFDINVSDNSRYMLAQKMGKNSSNFLYALPEGELPDDPVGNVQAPASQFKNMFVPVANLTCIKASSFIAIQGDFTVLLDYTSYNFTTGIGYQYWGRSCEKISCPHSNNLPLSEERTWALKGDAFVYGAGAQDATHGANELIALSATQSQALIYTGVNEITTGSNSNNDGIDNPRFGVTSTNGLNDRIMNAPNINTNDDDQQRTSGESIFLTPCDMDFVGPRTKGASHTLFIHFDYTYHTDNNSDWIISVGSSIELAQHDNDKCNTEVPCTTCRQCGLSQWAFWLRGSYNFY